MARGLEGAGEPEQADDQADVEQDRRRRRRGKALDTVENAGEQRHQGNEQQIGKGDPGECHRERELVRVGGKPGGEAAHQPGHGDFGEGSEDDEAPQQDTERLFGKRHRRRLALGLQAAGKQRHESEIESALGEQAAEQVGQFEGDEERVGDHAGADIAGDQNIAQESEHPRDQRETADRGREPE